MLPRHFRLPASEIPRVMKSGRRMIGNGLTFIYRLTYDMRQDTGSRFAFVISTKVDKRATVRNRMRRLLAESVQHMLPSLRPGIDGILVGSKQLISQRQPDIELQVRAVFERAQLFGSQQV